jgi:hypothetical protein
VTRNSETPAGTTTVISDEGEVTVNSQRKFTESNVHPLTHSPAADAAGTNNERELAMNTEQAVQMPANRRSELHHRICAKEIFFLKLSIISYKK